MQLNLKMEEKKIFCFSEWNIVYVGFLTSEMIFRKISDFKTHDKPLSIFINNINFQSHESLLFKENYSPFIYGVSEYIYSFIDKRVEIITKNGQGVISLTNDSIDKAAMNYDFLSKNVLCSDINGMKFLKKNNIEKVILRGEFLNDADNKKELLEKTLDYASNNFDEVIFRLTDYNGDSIIGERGSLALLNSKKYIMEEELDCINKYPNLSVLCPFVRNGDEAIKIYHYIRNDFSGKIGCMIEVPLIIYEGKKIAQNYDFFVLGIADLTQLLQGTDRNIYLIQYSTILFIAELLEVYFIPYISENKKVYVTYEPLFNLLRSKNENLNFLYLTK